MDVGARFYGEPDQEPRAIACLDLTLAGVALNLAFDEALLIEAEQRGGPGVLWFWDPPEYAVVLGASRRLHDEVRLEPCRVDDVPVLRRSTGGGTVVVGPGVLNVSVILPQTAAPGLWAIDTAHRYVLERLAESIRGLGAPVELRGTGDLTIGSRKCGGSAQRRLKQTFLVHCTILLDFALERVERYLTVPKKQPDYRAGRPHLEFLCNLGLPRATVAAAIRAHFCPEGSSRSLDPAPALPRALTLVQEKYGSPAWIERF